MDGKKYHQMSDEELWTFANAAIRRANSMEEIRGWFLELGYPFPFLSVVKKVFSRGFEVRFHGHNQLISIR